VRAELLFATAGDEPPETLAGVLAEQDPLLRHAAIGALARSLSGRRQDLRTLPSQLPALATLLAARRTSTAHWRQANGPLGDWLQSTEPAVRFAAVKWVADERLADFRPRIVEMLAEPQLDLATFLGIHVALQRLAGEKPSDLPPPQLLVDRVFSEETSPAIRRLALRLIDPALPALRVEPLGRLVSHADRQLREEALWTLALHPDPRRFERLVAVARDANQPGEFRAVAVAGLAGDAVGHRELLVELALEADAPIRDEALRSLVGAELTENQRTALRRLGEQPELGEAIRRVVERTPPARPAAEDTESWWRLLRTVKGQPDSGRRIFMGQKIGTCSKCHQVQGRGAAVGPDLSRISQRIAQAGADGRMWLLATLLQPSRDMAPQFTPWLIVTKDGKQYTGLPRRKGGNSEAYLGADGREFTLKKAEIEFHQESSVSIMPADLLQQFTLQELADLVAFLMEAPE
jgi:putative heme-binding domain-containing protein